MNGTVEQWAEAFDRISADWQRLRSRRAVERLSRWEVLFDEYVSAQQDLRNRGQWLSGPADLLSIIGRARRETFHSAMLAWLLDPGAPHGLGTAFLEKILESCFPNVALSPAVLAGAITECEVARHRSRADIVIWGVAITVVIEVKVIHDLTFRFWPSYPTSEGLGSARLRVPCIFCREPIPCPCSAANEDGEAAFRPPSRGTGGEAVPNAR